MARRKSHRLDNVDQGVSTLYTGGKVILGASLKASSKTVKAAIKAGRRLGSKPRKQSSL